MPTLKESLTEVKGSKYFSKVVLIAGLGKFRCIPIKNCSQLFFGWQYCCNKLPFEISSTPELCNERTRHEFKGRSKSYKQYLCNGENKT